MLRDSLKFILLMIWENTVWLSTIISIWLMPQRKPERSILSKARISTPMRPWAKIGLKDAYEFPILYKLNSSLPKRSLTLEWMSRVFNAIFSAIGDEASL